MKEVTEDILYVYDCSDPSQICLAGRLIFINECGRETVCFEGDKGYLKEISLRNPGLYSFLSSEKRAVLLLKDSLPESFGIRLLREKRTEDLSEKNLFLAGENSLRKGAFIISESENIFGDHKDSQVIPSVNKAAEFAEVVSKMEKGEETDRNLKDILIRNGVSLGGSVSKMNFTDDKGNIWIAKFPSVKDRYDVCAWECTASSLARECGINVPETELIRLAPGKSVFLSKRFDREKDRHIHFFSASSLLTGKDTEKSSYLDITEFICSYGCHIKKNLKELYKRMVFSVFINNTDNHLKNHGFILNDDGFELSPAFDMNPSPGDNWFSLAVKEGTNMPEQTDLTELAPYFQIKKKEAAEIIAEHKEIIKRTFFRLAVSSGIKEKEYEKMLSGLGLLKSL